MGHFYSTVKGTGKDRAEAQSDAIHRFLRENGTRHDVRGVSKARFLGTVPPMGVSYVEGNHMVMDYTKPNFDAPKDDWLQEWEFELHTHA